MKKLLLAAFFAMSAFVGFDAQAQSSSVTTDDGYVFSVSVSELTTTSATISYDMTFPEDLNADDYTISGRAWNVIGGGEGASFDNSGSFVLTGLKANTEYLYYMESYVDAKAGGRVKVVALLDANGLRFTTPEGEGGETPVDPQPVEAEFSYVAEFTANENNVVFNYVINKTVDGVTAPATEADGPFEVFYAWDGNDAEQKLKASTTHSGSFVCEGLIAGTNYNFYPKYNVNGKELPWTVVNVTTTGTRPDVKERPNVTYKGEYSFKAVEGHDDWAELTFKYVVTNPDNVEGYKIRFAAAGAPGDAVTGVEYEKWYNGDIIWGDVVISDAEGLTAGEHTATIIVKNLNKNRGNNCWMKSRVYLADETDGKETGGAGAWSVNPDELQGEDPEPQPGVFDYVNKSENLDIVAAEFEEDGKVKWNIRYDIGAAAGAELAGTSGDYYRLEKHSVDNVYFAPSFSYTIGNSLEGHVMGEVDFGDLELPVGFVMEARINGQDIPVKMDGNKGTFTTEDAGYTYRNKRVISYNFHLVGQYNLESRTIMFTYTLENAEKGRPTVDFIDLVQYNDDEKHDAHMQMGTIKSAGVPGHSDEPVGDWFFIARPVDDLDAAPWNPSHDYCISNPVTRDADSKVSMTVSFELENGTKRPADYVPVVEFTVVSTGNNSSEETTYRMPMRAEGETEGDEGTGLYSGQFNATGRLSVVNMFTVTTPAVFSNGDEVEVRFHHRYTSIRKGNGHSITMPQSFIVNTLENKIVERPGLTGIDDITVEEPENEVVEYYNLQGMRVSADNLSNGIYIRRAGNKTTKIYVR